jgi:hypothetical protein
MRPNPKKKRTKSMQSMKGLWAYVLTFVTKRTYEISNIGRDIVSGVSILCAIEESIESRASG